MGFGCAAAHAGSPAHRHSASGTTTDRGETREKRVGSRTRTKRPGSLLAFSLTVVAALIFAGNAFAEGPVIASDKADYAPGETVTLYGSYWGAAESVHINVNDDVGQTWMHDADVVAGLDGSFEYRFDLPNWFVAQYTVRAIGSSGLSATTTFTDAVVELGAWANSSGSWQGTLNGANSSYKEGQSFPVRFFKSFAAGTAHTVVLKYDFNSGTDHFVDHLTTVDRTIPITSTQICADLTGCSGSPSATAAIPVDMSNPPGARLSGQVLRAWNVQSMNVSSSSYTGSLRTITVDFTVASGSGNKDVAIAFGAHLARENEWGAGNGARSFPGGSGKLLSNIDNNRSDQNVSVNPSTAIADAATIGGKVYDDTDGDGVADPGEVGIAGVTVNLSGSTTDTALTQAGGGYSFSGLDAGTYTVGYTVPDGYSNTGVSSYPNLVVGATDHLTGKDFFARAAGTISGFKWNDVDGDGIVDGGESKLNGWTIQLATDTAFSNIIRTAVTAGTDGSGPTGAYSFSFLTPGTYYVRETTQPGWTQTFPGSPGYLTVTLSSANGYSTTIAKFGNRVPNTAPSCSNGNATTDEDTAVATTLSCSDAQNNTLTYTIVSGPSNGSLSGTAPNLTYTPNADYNGSDSFTYSANDGSLDSNTATFSITVTPVNDPPDAVNDGGSVAEDSATGVLVDVLANDSTGPANESGQSLTITNIGTPSHGTAVLEAGQIRYKPTEANYNGPDSFTYTARDNGQSGSPAADDFKSDTATVSITVTPVNDPPAAIADSAVASTRTSANGHAIAVLDIDNDGRSRSARAQKLYDRRQLHRRPVHEITAADLGASLSGNQVTYDPAPNYFGADSFTFKANDGNRGTATGDRLDHGHAGQRPAGCGQRRRLGCRRQRDRCARRCARERLDRAGERVGPVADDHEHRHAQPRHRRARGGPDPLQADRGQLQRARQLHLHGP